MGALVGDALGVPVEFSSRRDRDSDPVNDMRAFGTWNQPAGTWSDDGALLLCTAESLLENPSVDLAGQLYVRWKHEGHWAVRGKVFDIGNATGAALGRIAAGTPAAVAGGTGDSDNGNGSLMRILPVALRFWNDSPEIVADHAMGWSAITHRHARSQLACACYCLVARHLMQGASPESAGSAGAETLGAILRRFPAERPHFERLLDGNLAHLSRQEISSGGYVIDTLEAALWCLQQGGSFSEIVLRAVNLGGDTDTTGCVAGGLAGVWLGSDAIPNAWKDALAKNPPVEELIERLVGAS